jgi:hypothetical protein
MQYSLLSLSALSLAVHAVAVSCSPVQSKESSSTKGSTSSVVVQQHAASSSLDGNSKGKSNEALPPPGLITQIAVGGQAVGVHRQRVAVGIGSRKQRLTDPLDRFKKPLVRRPDETDEAFIKRKRKLEIDHTHVLKKKASVLVNVDPSRHDEAWQDHLRRKQEERNFSSMHLYWHKKHAREVKAKAASDIGHEQIDEGAASNTGDYDRHSMFRQRKMIRKTLKQHPNDTTLVEHAKRLSVDPKTLKTTGKLHQNVQRPVFLFPRTGKRPADADPIAWEQIRGKRGKKSPSVPQSSQPSQPHDYPVDNLPPHSPNRPVASPPRNIHDVFTDIFGPDHE